MQLVNILYNPLFQILTRNFKPAVSKNDDDDDYDDNDHNNKNNNDNNNSNNNNTTTNNKNPAKLTFNVTRNS